MTEQTLVEPKENKLAVFNEVIALMDKMEVENEKLVFDYETPQGEKEARSHIAKLRKIKSAIANAHKEGKADILKEGRLLDSTKNELTARAEKMIKVHKDPLDAIEAERQRLNDEEKRKAEEEEAKRQAELEARERAVREAEEKIERERREAEEKLAREKAEKERIEREKRIAEEAAERAKKEAEEQFERGKREAEEKAKAEIERIKAEAVAKELAEKKKKEVEAEKERKRIENKKHREKIEEDIRLAFIGMGWASNDAEKIRNAIKNNHVPHVSINY